MKKAIIIFVRNPELGKVKTRLAKEAGDKKALAVYTELLKHTHDIVCAVDSDRFVYYADGITGHDLWEISFFIKKPQQGEGLGERMKMAFFELFEQGYSKIVIIGSDCPGLTPTIIEDAFERLALNDVVIGPTEDGGYYLLGLTHLIPELFKNKKWSTDTVLRDTILTTVELRKQCVFLPELYDIDTAADLDRYRQVSKE